MNKTRRGGVISRKQALDLVQMMKAVVVAAAKFTAAAPDTKEKENTFAEYQEHLDTFADYVQYLSEDKAPPIMPPKSV